MKKKKKTLYKTIRELGFDIKFSKKISKRKNGEFDKVRLEEMLFKYKGDTSLVEKVFDGNKSLTKKEINKFINAERRERKAFKGRYAGELSKRERGILADVLKTDGLSGAKRLLKNDTIDIISRSEEFKQIIGKGKVPPKYMINDIKRINKIMGASPSGKPGFFVVREMYINGLTESEAIELIRERQSPVDKDTVFYS
ncbi:hypothetical protein P4356_32280 [Bacillus thuringiensis]|nr:hypothetical protein [Bacillus thuringiensis]